MPTIFSKIISGEIPAYKVAEDDNFLAFLDIFPLSKGHTLVIPKHETDYIFDMESDEYANLWKFAQKVAKAQKLVIDCARIGVAVIGLEVAHTHIHLVPINGVEDINFSREKLSFTKEEFEQTAQSISTRVLL
ncbi:MAG: HIT family protein [Flavobacteriales bacterium]|nr:HIT family protein [Flavobacteriales bacterium]MBL6872681.1 HIT family protein [Flavobacteriales bacterium]